MSDDHIKWKRFWRPSEVEPVLEGAYLADPHGKYSRFSNPQLKTLEELEGNSCLVLLGDAGVGKSSEISRWKKRQQDKKKKPLYLNLKGISDDYNLQRKLFGHSKFTEWRQNGGELELILDSLDECLLHFPQVAESLGEELLDLDDVEGLSLRIACRSANWYQTGLGGALKEKWRKGFSEYHLAPLRYLDVKKAADERLGNRAKGFLAGLVSLELGTLASLPLTLLMLIEQFDRDGLSDDRNELFRNCCRYLCEESTRTTTSTKPPVDPDKRFAVAERIAAMCVFSGKSSMFIGKSISVNAESQISLSEIVGGEERATNKVSTPVEQSVVLETLEAGLFDQMTPKSRGWAHWSYAEFLAASYLCRHKVSPERILKLFSSVENFGDGPIIPEKLKEVAAWVVAMKPEVKELVISTDPAFLLRTQISFDVQTRSLLAEKILRQLVARKIQLRDMEYSDLPQLNHPGLADQLRPILTNRSLNEFVRASAVNIAESCKVAELLDDLVTIAVDRSEKEMLRVEAGHAVYYYGETQHKINLRPLLEHDEDDPYNRLKGYALSSLWPEHIEAKELFEKFITIDKDPHFHSRYQSFVSRELVPSMKGRELESLPYALEWVYNHSSELPFEYHDLKAMVTAILKVACEHIDDTHVLKKLAPAVWENVKNHQPPFGEKVPGGVAPGQLEKSEHRKALVCAIFKLLEGQDRVLSSRTISLSCLVFKDDFDWLLEGLLAATTNEMQEVWSRLLRNAYDFDDGARATTIYDLRAETLAVAKYFDSFFAPCELDSDAADYARRQYERENQPEDTPDGPPPFNDLVENGLKAWGKGKTDA